MKYGFGLFLALACTCFLTACSDSLNIDPSDTSAPEVNSISPTSGQIGTVVKIEGAHLHNVTSIKIGGAETNITRVNPSIILAEITKDNITGEVEVTNEFGSTVYGGGIFTVEYLRPTVTEAPQEGTVFTEAEIKGENLDLIKEIEIGGVSIPSEEFEEQNEDKIVFIIPYYEANGPVTIKLKYNYGVEPTVIELPQPFKLIVTTPEVTSFTKTIFAGSALEINGSNLNVIEQVLVNGTPVTIVSKTADKLSCSVPADFTANGSAEVTLVYYNGKVTKNIGSVQVVVPATNIWNNVTLKATYQNFFSGITGQYYTMNEFTANKSIIHLAVSGHDGNEWLQIESLNANGNFAGSQVKKDGWAMRFRKLKESNATDKKYIDLVKNGGFMTTPLSLSMITADGLSTSTKKQVIRYKFAGNKWNGEGNNNAETYNTTNDEGICPGGVNLVMLLDASGKVVNVALVEFVSVTQGASFSTSSMTVNFYFPKQ